MTLILCRFISSEDGRFILIRSSWRDFFYPSALIIIFILSDTIIESWSPKALNWLPNSLFSALVHLFNYVFSYSLFATFLPASTVNISSQSLSSSSECVLRIASLDAHSSLFHIKEIHLSSSWRSCSYISIIGRVPNIRVLLN